MRKSRRMIPNRKNAPALTTMSMSPHDLDSPDPPAPPRDAVLLVSMLCVLLLILQFTSLTKLWVIVTGSRGSLAEYVGLVLNIDWTGFDLTLFGLSGLSALALIVLEIVRGSWTAFLIWVTDSERRTKTVVLVFSLIAVRYYFSPGGLNWVGDAALHTLYAWIAAEGFAQGTIPVWTPLVAAGTPFLQFYGFLYFYIAGAIQALVGELELATKITLGGGHALSGLTMYLFVRSALDSRRAGLFAGLTYVLTFWHLQHVLIMGRYTTSLFYTLLPVSFLCLHRACVETDWKRWTAGGSLSIAALFYAHPGFALWSCGFLLVYGVCIARTWSRADWKQATIRIVLSLGLGGLLTTYLTVPMLLEREFTGMRGGVDLSGFEDPFWEQLLIWSNFHVNFVQRSLQNWYGGYLGLVPMALALIGLVTFKWRTRGRSLAVASLCAFGLVASWGLIFGYRWLTSSGLTVLKTMSPGRFQLFLVFFMAVAAGLAIESLPSRRILSSRIFSIGLLLLFLDLGPTTIRAPFHFVSTAKMMGTTDKSLNALKRDEIQMREGRYHDYRILHASRSHNSSLITVTGHPSIVCMYEEHTLADHYYLRPIIAFVDNLVQSHGLDASEWLKTNDGNRALQALLLTNTRAFMTIIKTHEKRQQFNLKLSEASPVHVTSRIELSELIPRMDARSVLDLVARMGLNSKNRRLGRVFVVDGATESIPGEEAPRVNVISNDVYIDRRAHQPRSEPTLFCAARLRLLPGPKSFCRWEPRRDSHDGCGFHRHQTANGKKRH